MATIGDKKMQYIVVSLLMLLLITACGEKRADDGGEQRMEKDDFSPTSYKFLNCTAHRYKNVLGGSVKCERTFPEVVNGQTVQSTSACPVTVPDCIKEDHAAKQVCLEKSVCNAVDTNKPNPSECGGIDTFGLKTRSELSAEVNDCMAAYEAECRAYRISGVIAGCQPTWSPGATQEVVNAATDANCLVDCDK